MLYVYHDHKHNSRRPTKDYSRLSFAAITRKLTTVRMSWGGCNYDKLKTNLRLAINRLKLLEKKKTELALKSRKEIADYISASKDDRARIRVEHIIREDYMVEAMEMVEMYCDLMLARLGLIKQTQ